MAITAKPTVINSAQPSEPTGKVRLETPTAAIANQASYEALDLLSGAVDGDYAPDRGG